MKRFLLPAVLGAGLISGVEAHDRVTTTITWSREISRIVYERCGSCHRPKGAAFSLMTYEAARPWAVAIKEEVLNRRMPPWGGVKGFGDFRNDQALTQEQIELITDWVEGGVPEGDPKDAPPEPKYAAPAAVRNSSNQIAVSGDFKLTRAFRLDGLRVERAPAGASFQVFAQMPDGSMEPLLWLYQYRETYRQPFLLRKPLSLPAGTVIRGVPSEARVILLPRA